MLIKLLFLALVTFLGFFFSYNPENVDFSIKITILFGALAAIFIFIVEPSTEDISPKSAAGIAGANPMRTAINSVKTGWLAYVIPFVIVFSPGLVMEGGAILVVITVTTLIIGIFLISVAMTGYFLRPVGPAVRAVTCLSGLLLCIPINSFPAATYIVAVAAALGISLLAFEVVVRNRSDASSGGTNHA